MVSSYHPLAFIAWTLLGMFVRRNNAGQICGNIGTHNYTGTTYYMGNFFFKAPSTFALCADFCKNDYPRCKSFRYSYYSDADAQYCEFFPDWLETFFINDDSQPYYYYDVDCAFPTYAVTETAVQLSTFTIALSTTTSLLTNLTTTTLVSTTTATATVTNTAIETQPQLITTLSTVLVPVIQTSTATVLLPTTQTSYRTVRSSITATLIKATAVTTTIKPEIKVISTAIAYVTTYKTVRAACKILTTSKTFTKNQTITSKTITTVTKAITVTKTTARTIKG